MESNFYAALVLSRAKAVEADLRNMAEVKRLNAEDIGPLLKLTPATVHKYADLLGIDLVRKPHPEKNYDKSSWLPTVRRLRSAGKTWAEIGKVLGTSRITACRFGIQNGLGTYEAHRRNGKVF